MTTSTAAARTTHMPPVHCTPCRVTVNGNRWRVYADGSVSAALSLKEANALSLQTVKEVRAYESALPRLIPHSTEAATIRREASRQRRNRNSRERHQAMQDLGMKRSPATPGGWE